MADPSLAAIVVPLVGGDALAACLAALRLQAVHIHVIDRSAGVRDVPGRRRHGVAATDRPLVALIEDTVIVEAGWADAIIAAFRDPAIVAVGGPVRIAASLPPPVRALALTEYGRYQRPPNGDPPALPGCNFAFRRAALMDAMPAEGLIDAEVFAGLRARGVRLGWAPDMAVTYSGAYRAGAALSTRYAHGRLYAGRMLGDAPLGRRLLGAAKALALPAVLTARTVREARRPERRSPATLGWVAAQHAAWAAGELAGALLGPPPAGVEAWR